MINFFFSFLLLFNSEWIKNLHHIFFQFVLCGVISVSSIFLSILTFILLFIPCLLYSNFFLATKVISFEN